MAERRARMEGRLLRAALARRKGGVALAVLAVAIGTSVAAALLHLSDDVSRKVGKELRVLGPNVLIVPEPVPSPAATPTVRGAGGAFLEERAVRQALDRAGLRGGLLLYATARVSGHSIPIVGCEAEAARALHPTWFPSDAELSSFMGARLAQRLAAAPGRPLTLTSMDGGRTEEHVVEAVLDLGGSNDEAWWMPLATVQRLAGRPGQVSTAEARIEGNAAGLPEIVAALEADGSVRALPLHALSATEAGLLERMRRLMLLVTAAALLAGGLAAYGTLVDLALVRRREIALMKSLGARRRDVIRQFVSESMVIGTAGGVTGWLIGVFFAELIGRRVFHSAIDLNPGIPLVVLGLALVVSLLASVGPIQFALRMEPAPVLKGE